MSSLVSKLDSLNLGDERSILFGYIWRTKQTKKFFVCKNNFFVIPDSEGSRMVLCQKKRFGTEECFICLKCTNMTAFDNLGQSANLSSLKEEYCLHAKLCSVIFDGRGEEICDIPENGFVDVLKQEKEFIGLVHAPPNLQKKYPGIIVLNSNEKGRKRCNDRPANSVQTAPASANVEKIFSL